MMGEGLRESLIHPPTSGSLVAGTVGMHPICVWSKEMFNSIVPAALSMMHVKAIEVGAGEMAQSESAWLLSLS